MDSIDERLLELRRTLHECPEIAGDEVRTANVIGAFLRTFEPNRIMANLGGWGIAAVFEGRSDGPTIMVRCELDALPATEDAAEPLGQMQYAHLCGHDGHMTMVAGLAPWLAERAAPCRVVLMFQPAEETGEGARRVIDDPRFTQIKPDYAVALHNLPGYETGHVVLRDGTFACSSVGLEVSLTGHRSHAAEPENAASPMRCLCHLPGRLLELGNGTGSSAGRQVTITHLTLGKPDFGTTPGEGMLLATLRSETDEDMAAFKRQAERLVRDEPREEGLQVKVEWHEEFPVTRSDAPLVEALRSCCAGLHMPTVEVNTPFRWSDDFGYFGDVCPSLFFGLGSGVDAPRLHQHDYSFPNELIPTGVSVFHELIDRIASGRSDGA